MQPLVITPVPLEHESLKGFVLRTSEMNGYTSPNDMLRYVGMTDNEARSIRLPLDKLALLYGRPATELASLAYVNDSSTSYGKEFVLCGHPLSVLDLNVKVAKLCPACVRECGFIDAFWDLRHALACPKHGQLALRQCPHCKADLKWQRPGLLICTCGHDFSHASCAPVSSEVKTLMEVIRRKLHRETLDDDWGRSAGIHIDGIQSVLLRTLFGIIQRLGNIKLGRKDSGNDTNMDRVISIAADALTRWPEGLYDYLKDFGSTLTEKELSHVGARKQFHRFYEPLFTNELPQEGVQFLRDGYRQFLTDVWKKALIDPRTDPEGDICNSLITLQELSRESRIAQPTLKKLLNQDILKPAAIIKSPSGRPRFLFNMAQAKRVSISRQGNTLGSRDAAGMLGIPVSVLEILHKNGTYVVKSLPKSLASYHEADLESFKDLALQGISPMAASQVDRSQNTTIGTVLNMKLNGVQKAAVIEAVIQRQLKPIGYTAPEISAIVLEKASVEAFLRARRPADHNGLMAHEVGKLIRARPQVIQTLWKTGVLSAHRRGKVMLVSERSVTTFTKKYITCAELATQWKTSSRKVVSMLEAKGVAVLKVSDGQGGAQAFVERRYVQNQAMSVPRRVNAGLRRK